MENSKVVKVKAPELTIERVMFNSETGEVQAVDIHNETDGCAYFFSVPSIHFHGFNKRKPPIKGKGVSKKKV